MENIGSIEFLDLTGISEEEKSGILHSLHTWNPKVEVPWKRPYQVVPKSTVPLETSVNTHQNLQCNGPPPNVIIPPAMPVMTPPQAIYTQYPVVTCYQSMSPPDSTTIPPVYPAQVYPYYHHSGPGIPQQITVATQPLSPIVVQSYGYVNQFSPNQTIQSPIQNQIVQNQFAQNEIVQTPVRSQGVQKLVVQQTPIVQQNPHVQQNPVVQQNPHVQQNPVVQSQIIQNQVVPHQTIQNPAFIQNQGPQNQPIQNQVPHQIEDVESGFELDQIGFENVDEQNGTKTNIQKDDEEVKPAQAKTWASLFGSSSKTANRRAENGEVGEMVNIKTNVQSPPNVNNHLEECPSVDDKMRYRYDDPVYHRLGEYLSSHIIDHRTISLQPRGLINRSNYCYINSILQALLACPPVYNLLIGLAELITTNAKRKHIPVIDNMAKFVKEFQHLPAAQRVSRRVDKNAKQQDPNSIINCDVPFEPGYIYKMLNGMRSDTFVVEGRQEDAEEFLGCLLNGLNDEMLELMKLVGKQRTKSVMEVTMDDSADDKEWQVMGPKNKGCVTRRIDVIQTPLSDVFSGHLRSRLHRTGDKCTDNIQPFFTLQLNIEKVSTVRDALEALVSKNQLEGVTSSKTNKEVEAWQQVTIEELPYVLVLHLKCFDYKLDGCTKIIKAMEFPIDLKIDSKLLSSKTNYTSKEKQYKLFAVVYHDGKEASKGHYLTDAYHVGYARWLRYDDATVKPVPEEQVLKPHGTRVPYLLFYRRSDSIRGK